MIRISLICLAVIARFANADAQFRSSSFSSDQTVATLDSGSIPRRSWQYAPGKLLPMARPVLDGKQDRQPVVKYPIFALSGGVWIPQGRNAILGAHPVLGVMIGQWRNQWLFELNLEFRFIRTPGDYYVLYGGSPEQTHNYFGGFIGFHVGYGLINREFSTVYALAGCGLDGFDAIEADANHATGISINTFAKNIGIGVQHFNKKGGMVGLEVTYDFVHYRNTGGTDLSGNGVTVRLLIGGVGN